MKCASIITLLLLIGCSSDVISKPPINKSPDLVQNSCPNNECSFGENPLNCSEDCGDVSFTVPKSESSEIGKVTLFGPGQTTSQPINFLDILDQQTSCKLLRDKNKNAHGWHSGYFPTREPNTRLLPFWSYPSSCPITKKPHNFQGRKARIRFELKSDGYYNIGIWTPKFFEMCASKYENDDQEVTVPMMTHIHVILKINSDTPNPQYKAAKFYTKTNNTKEGTKSNIFPKIPLRQGEHELWILDYSPNATQCPSTSQNSTPDDEIFFVDNLYFDYLEPLQ